ncbi:Dps family protein [Pseudoalteromonas sp. XMcav1-K]|uniref:Dps family protein n=1 Tax=Pseudoalteromonas sp. XMcav1-K TaxID=3374372 RepID=UPI00375739CF
MKNVSIIGLDKAITNNLVAELNTLLSSYQIQYMNARGFHWNIKGENFFELHAKFEEIYNDLLLKVDEIAERILTLGGEPLHGFSDYLANSKITEAKNISAGREAISNLLTGFSELIATQRSLLTLAGDAEDEGTASLMSDYIKEQEKLVWMLNAYLN